MTVDGIGYRDHNKAILIEKEATMNVSVRELKSHLSKYLSQARAGQTIEVTSHRKVVARIIGVPEASSDGIARLVTNGAATWSGGKPAGASLQLELTEKTVSSLVLEDRS